ncbi:hypothetical protein H2200_008014 [Cladophialophora chaetospira]|uniref:Uncharacterized protein n=1 Tax=Cladophialophora chaetospira TaxID=386627 RepID=A0AA38X6U3_9EURO|nr:hypothetical protein H2200_008014 [Cladophialophora chaetospira]
MLGRVLFEKITIVPHFYFLEKFIYTFQRSRLRDHVRQVLIDFCWVGQLFSKAALRDAGSERPHAGSVNTLEEYNNFYKRGQEANVSSLESAMLATTLTLTTNVEVVEVDFEGDLDRPGRFDFEGTRWPIPPPIYVNLLESLGADTVDLRQKNIEPIWHAPDRLHRSLATALGTSVPKLRNLILHRFDPFAVQGDADSTTNFAFHGYSATMFLQALSRISHLDMRLSDDDDLEDPLSFSKCVASMLQKAFHLSSLRLHSYETFTCRWDVIGVDVCDISRSILARWIGPEMRRGAFPALKSLWLQNLDLTTKEIEDFLTVQCPQLRHLTIQNCVLLPEIIRLGDECRPCWVAVLKNLKRKLALESIDLRGFLTNLGRQHWHILEHIQDEELDSWGRLGPWNESQPELLSHLDDDKEVIDAVSAKTGIKPRFVEWFLDKEAPDGSCPLNVFEIAPNEKDVVRSDMVLQAATRYGSWTLESPRQSVGRCSE